MSFLKIIKENNKYNLDYEKINSNISENIRGNLSCDNKDNKKRFGWTKALIVVLTLGVISLSFAVGFMNRYSQHQYAEIYEDKECYIKSQSVDLIIAFGNDNGSKGFDVETIINSRLLSDEDKQILLDYNEKAELEDGYENEYLVCVGIKDGNDIVSIIHNVFKGKTLEFNSNLDYSLRGQQTATGIVISSCSREREIRVEA